MAVRFTINTSNRNEFIDITEQVRQAVTERNIQNGICCVFVPHTTAGVTINEGADPDVQRDILGVLNEIVPSRFPYRHSEGNSPAHIKAGLMGSSVQVIIEGGQLLLGTWQSIFFCEFDGPRTRKVYLSLVSHK